MRVCRDRVRRSGSGGVSEVERVIRMVAGCYESMADAVRNAAGEYEATDQGSVVGAEQDLAEAMIPARSVLATWRTTELAELGESFRIDGKAISVAGDRVGQQIASLTHNDAWDGDSQRPQWVWPTGSVSADCVADIGTSVSNDFKTYGSEIAAERINIDRLVAVIEKGPAVRHRRMADSGPGEKMTPDRAKLGWRWRPRISGSTELAPGANSAGPTTSSLIRTSQYEQLLAGMIDHPREMFRAFRRMSLTRPTMPTNVRSNSRYWKRHMFGTVVDKETSRDGDKAITELRMPRRQSSGVHRRRRWQAPCLVRSLQSQRGPGIRFGQESTELWSPPCSVPVVPGHRHQEAGAGRGRPAWTRRTLSSPSSMRLWTPRRRHSIRGHHSSTKQRSHYETAGSFLTRIAGRLAAGVDMASATVTVMSTLTMWRRQITTMNPAKPACEGLEERWCRSWRYVLARRLSTFWKSMAGGSAETYLGEGRALAVLRLKTGLSSQWLPDEYLNVIP